MDLLYFIHVLHFLYDTDAKICMNFHKLTDRSSQAKGFQIWSDNTQVGNERMLRTMEDVQQPRTKMKPNNMLQRYHRTLLAIVLIGYTTTACSPTDAFTTPSTHCKFSDDYFLHQSITTLNSGAKTRTVLHLSTKLSDSPEFFKGKPSTPGFKPGQFERLTSWAMSESANRPIVAEYDPDGLWVRAVDLS